VLVSNTSACWREAVGEKCLFVLLSFLWGFRSFVVVLASCRTSSKKKKKKMASGFSLVFKILAIFVVLAVCSVLAARIDANLGMRGDLTKGDRSDPTKMHQVVFVVKSRNMESLKMTLNDISDMDSSNYGKHLTRAQISELTANPEGNRILTNVLSTYPAVSVEKRSRDNRFVTVKAPIGLWERLFSAEFYSFSRTNRKGRVDLVVDRAMSYEIPVLMAEHLDAVFNTVQMPGLSKAGVRGPQSGLYTVTAGANPAPQPIMSGSVTPQMLNSFYEIPSNDGKFHGSQSLYEALDQDYSPDDLHDFQLYFSLAVNPVALDINGHNSSTYCVVPINQTANGNCTEANLDVQYIMAVAQNVSTVYYYDTSPDDEFMATWASELLEMDQPPLVNSVSYGEYEHLVAPEYLSSFEDSAIKLGAMGVTIFASSGDDGVAGYLVRDNVSACGYFPQWPASSPYVTAVGGTQGPENDLPEVACTSDGGGIITTGGGFSNVFGMPSWQQTAVAGGYFSELAINFDQPAPGFNVSGRAYPDISALAYNYWILQGGQWLLVSGTVRIYCKLCIIILCP
jgi:tripeptidyl-peptidase-1